MSDHQELTTPVNVHDRNTEATQVEDGMALCLSGGGYRAMVFHAGVLIRLNEAGVLPQLKRISSVSGGSITAATLGLHWKKLTFVNGVASNLDELVIQPIRRLAGHTIDAGSILGGLLSPFSSIGDKIAGAYAKHLFGAATLQDLPDDEAGEGPRFVINATNVQSGALWRFSRPYMGDYRVGRTKSPNVSLAVAVGASSAFPPVLSPVVLPLAGGVYLQPAGELQLPPYTTEAVLADGGVYDNLGLETAWKRYRTILVSDGGGKMQSEPKPAEDWARHALRINDIIDNQVRSLRKRQLIEAFKDGTVHRGAYWGIRTNIAHYAKSGVLNCPQEKVLELAGTPTRLKELEPRHQERLMNLGYAVSAAALETFIPEANPVPATFPYPGGI